MKPKDAGLSDLTAKMGNKYTLGHKFPVSFGEAISERNRNRSPEIYAQASAKKKKRRLYPNLDAELEKRFITYRGLARLLNVSEHTICNRMLGNSKFSLELKFAIKEILQTDLSIEELFWHED